MHNDCELYIKIYKFQGFTYLTSQHTEFQCSPGIVHQDNETLRNISMDVLIQLPTYHMRFHVYLGNLGVNPGSPLTIHGCHYLMIS